jgi:hypoxanthine phosphoribosyltransferase
MTITEPKLLIPEARIRARIEEIAQEINQDYQDKEIVAICVLKGSFIYFSDLIRAIDVPLSCEFLGVSSYGNRTVSSGEVKITLDMNEPLENKHVLIIEDIVDSGLTLSFILNMLKARRPASIKTSALLVKTENLQIDVPVDYPGFKIGKEFVVGYGIDHAGKHRGLPDICVIENAH